VKEFEKYRYELDDAITTGKLEPAFAIFNRFQQRNRERMALRDQAARHRTRLQAWTRSSNSTASKRPGPPRSAELDELWRKRVKNDAVSLMLTDKTWAETRDILKKRYERVAKRSEQITATTCSRTS
jgi:carboxyl-terminal processing protease